MKRGDWRAASSVPGLLITVLYLPCMAIRLVQKPYSAPYSVTHPQSLCWSVGRTIAYFSTKLSLTELCGLWCISGRMKPFAVAGLLTTRTVLSVRVGQT